MAVRCEVLSKIKDMLPG